MMLLKSVIFHLREGLLLVEVSWTKSDHLRLASKRTTFLTVSVSVLPNKTWEWF